MQSKVPSLVPLVEASPIPEVFATGMVPVEYCGEFVRLIFYSEQTVEGGRRERIISGRIVMPTMGYHELVKNLIDAPSIMM